MRRFGAAATGVAAGGVAILLAAAYFVAADDRDTTQRPVPRVAGEEQQSDRRPRINGDMTATMQTLQRLADEPTRAKPPSARAAAPAVEAQPIPARTDRPAASPAPVSRPVPQPTGSVASAPALEVQAAPATSVSVAPADRARPVSLVPYGRKTDGRSVDVRETAAFNALAARSTARASQPSPPVAAAPVSLTQVAQPPEDLQKVDVQEDVSNLTADQLNEREHRRHGNAAGSPLPILPLQ